MDRNAIIAVCQVLFFTFIVAAVAIVLLYERKRKKEIKDDCLANGFSYEEKSDMLAKFIKGYWIGSNGWAHSCSTVCSGTMCGIHFSLMDYYYHIGGKNGGRTETLCIFHCPDFNVPHFFIREEFFFDGIAEFFGGQDIDFLDDPTFSDKFLLRGEDEVAVRKYFKYGVRRAFLNKHIKGCCYEGDEGVFIIEVYNHQDKNQRNAFLSMCIALFSAIMPKSGDESVSSL